MKIGGLEKLTLIDYPQKLACTLFISGCNFRCPWCYSPELVLPAKIKNHPEIEKSQVLEFLKKRKSKIEGVVVCGGEPTAEKHLPKLLSEIKEMGFLIKLDTNGSFPDALKNILEEKLVDYIAMDIKAPLLKKRYKEATGVFDDVEKIKKSIKIIKESGVDYEFRTTLVRDIHKKEDIERIAKSISGAKRYYLQNFFPEKTIKEDFLNKKPFSKEEVTAFKKEADPFVKFCKIR